MSCRFRFLPDLGGGYARAQILAHDGYLINLGHPEMGLDRCKWSGWTLNNMFHKLTHPKALFQ